MHGPIVKELLKWENQLLGRILKALFNINMIYIILIYIYIIYIIIYIYYIYVKEGFDKMRECM